MARPEVEVTGNRISIAKLNELFTELRELFRAVKREKRDAVSIADFCEGHGISVALYYKLKDQGQTPVEMEVGSRKLISKEAAAAWRRAREAATEENTTRLTKDLPAARGA